MKPRIPLPDDVANEAAMPVVFDMAPAIVTARGQLRRASFRARTLDAVTTELVRMRNARFQNCFY